MRSSEEIISYCDLWNGTFNAVFHSANAVLALGLITPQNFEWGLLCMKVLIMIGLIINLTWAFDMVFCIAPSTIVWNSLYILVNLFYVVILMKKHCITILPSNMVDFYENVFKPFRIPKKVRSIWNIHSTWDFELNSSSCWTFLSETRIFRSEASFDQTVFVWWPVCGIPGQLFFSTFLHREWNSDVKKWLFSGVFFKIIVCNSSSKRLVIEWMSNDLTVFFYEVGSPLDFWLK